jgi:hypothetical protein
MAALNGTEGDGAAVSPPAVHVWAPPDRAMDNSRALNYNNCRKIERRNAGGGSNSQFEAVGAVLILFWDIFKLFYANV